MAHLLGNKFYIESLQKDVGDLQAIVFDIFSRTGSVSVPSWKYPDKLSSDLDINELLDRYDYSDNEEDCQVSHVILLELVIDRLVLVIQSFAKYNEQMILMGRGTPSTSISSNISVGLVVKKHWNKMVQLHSALQQLQTDHRSKTHQLVELQEVIESTPKMLDFSLSTVRSKDMKSSSPLSISIDYNCKSTQTYETSFIPCEACDGSQYCLRQAANHMDALFKSQSLISCLSKVNKKHGDSWMSVQDIRTWVSEQEKDLLQLTTHMTSLSSTVASLHKELETCKIQSSKYQSDLKNSKKEIALHKENITITRKNYEKKLQENRENNSQVVNDVERKNSELMKTKEGLEVNVADLRCQLQQQVTALKSLESAQEKLLDDLESNNTNHQVVKRSQKYVEILEKELKEMNGKMEDYARSIAREEAKNRSSVKKNENLRTKQSELFEQIERLEMETEDLKTELADLESEKETIAIELETANADLSSVISNQEHMNLKSEEFKVEKNKHKSQIKELEDTVLNLELHVQKAKEQERLLIEYPDLNGPINSDFEGTGDIAHDMENQIRANSVRINILTEENNHLRNSVRKILETTGREVLPGPPREAFLPNNNQSDQPANKGNIPPLQLWR